MLVHTFLIIISAWQCTEVETEGGGGAERWAESFYLTPWDDVKSPTSLPPPTPSSLPYAEELATGFVWGVGVMTERTHMHAVSPPFLQNGEQQIFLFLRHCSRSVHKPQSRQQVQREEILWFQSNIQQGKKSSQWKYEVWEIEMCTSSLLTETVGCLKIFWTPAMRKLWLELPLDFEMHPFHCTHGTVFCFIVPSAGQPLNCVTHAVQYQE